MNPLPLVSLALDLIAGAITAAPDIVEIITGKSAAELQERIARARKELEKAPLDTTAADAARREAFVRAVRGE